MDHPAQTATARAVATAARTGGDARSRVASGMLSDLMALTPTTRRDLVRGLPVPELAHLLAVVEAQTGTPYGLWVDDPVGFTTDVLGDAVWSLQAEVLGSLVDHTITAVPSAVGMGKTFIGARAVLWFSSVHPLGTAKVVTTAPRLRQVRRGVWPDIRAAAKKAGLPLQVDQMQAKARAGDGTLVDVAYGFSAPPNREDAMQGIHAPRLLIIVDEAGGISRVVGRSMRGILTGDGTRLLALGNPPTDDEGSWFEGLCTGDRARVIPLSAYDSPAVTGEAVRCRACPPEVPAHLIGQHMNGPDWIAETIAEHGEDAPYVVAKVKARFPKGGAARAIPTRWVDLAAERPDTAADGARLCDLDLPDETSVDRVAAGAVIRLGVDVAADGGDEFSIARVVGDLVTIEHTSAGADNANATDVAGVVLTHIRRAERLATRLGTAAKVRVKVDGLGVGWGVASILQAWASEGLHAAEVVSVIVSEGDVRDNPDTDMRPWRKRDEMWLAARDLLRPTKVTGEQASVDATEGEETSRLRLRVDDKTLAQLRNPKYGTNASGYTVIESKKSLRERGVPSPDRAESLLLALYEPAPKARGVGVQIIGAY